MYLHFKRAEAALQEQPYLQFSIILKQEFGMKYLHMLRVKHYLKNLLILFPMFFGKAIWDLKTWKCVLAGFGSFCAISSAIYIINDIKDLESDRKHPVKCRRPLAAGEISVSKALVIVSGLFLVSGLLGWVASEYHLSILWLFIYFILNIFYSVFGGKHIPLIDIAILVSGFLIRVIYGGAVSGIAVSDWLYLVILMTSFYFALGKRRNELRWHGKKGRKVLKKYSIEFLDKNMYMCAGLAMVFYSLWCTSSLNVPGSIWTVPLVLLMFMKYSMDLEGETDGDPIEILTGDRMLLLMGGGYFFIMVYLVYFCT